MLMHRRCKKYVGRDAMYYCLRGIYVCDRWNVFENFLADMGVAPTASHSIDRLDSNGPYSPDNCRWATPLEQRRNQRRVFELEFRGQRKTPAEWARDLGISNKRIHARMKRGWSVERALSTPV